MENKIIKYIDFLNEADYCRGLSLNVDFFWDIDDDVEFLKAKNYKILENELFVGAKLAGMKVIDNKLTEYGDKNPNYGFTYLIVLSQSHAIIHTWSEEYQMNIDVFTCGNEGDPHKIIDHLKEKFSPKHIQKNQATRGFRKDIEDADETPDTMNDLKK